MLSYQNAETIFSLRRSSSSRSMLVDSRPTWSNTTGVRETFGSFSRSVEFTPERNICPGDVRSIPTGSSASTTCGLQWNTTFRNLSPETRKCLGTPTTSRTDIHHRSQSVLRLECHGTGNSSGQQTAGGECPISICHHDTCIDEKGSDGQEEHHCPAGNIRLFDTGLSREHQHSDPSTSERSRTMWKLLCLCNDRADRSSIRLSARTSSEYEWTTDRRLLHRRFRMYWRLLRYDLCLSEDLQLVHEQCQSISLHSRRRFELFGKAICWLVNEWSRLSSFTYGQRLGHATGLDHLRSSLDQSLHRLGLFGSDTFGLSGET